MFPSVGSGSKIFKSVQIELPVHVDSLSFSKQDVKSCILSEGGHQTLCDRAETKKSALISCHVLREFPQLVLVVWFTHNRVCYTDTYMDSVCTRLTGCNLTLFTVLRNVSK